MSYQVWTPVIRYKISPNQLYFLDCCRHKITPVRVDVDNERNDALHDGYLTSDNKLTDKALVILDEFDTFLIKTKKKVATEVLGDNFLDNIKFYRETFPAIKLPTGSMARQTIQELKDKFIWFFQTYPEYDWDVVLDATDLYVYDRSLHNYEFTINSSYFIKKTESDKTIKSTLATYCQNILDNPDLLKVIPK